MVENKRKIIKRISSIFVAFASALMLCISPFLPKIQPKTMIASADISTPNYTFQGSNILTNTSITVFGGGLNGYPMGLGYIIPKITLSASGFSFSYFGQVFLDSNNDGSGDNIMFNQSLSLPFVFDVGTEVLMPAITYDSMDTYVKGWYHCESAFNFNVIKVQIYSDFNAKPYNWTHIKYFDNNNRYCDFAFQFYSSTPDDLFLDDRTYYLTNIFSDNQSYQEGYVNGEKIGFNNGYSAGESVGYSSGQNVGYNSGYNVGYQDGVNGANTYSFYNLISAVVDAPVQAFMGLFNFELLGVNLADFFLSLLTLSFIITLLRLFL